MNFKNPWSSYDLISSEAKWSILSLSLFLSLPNFLSPPKPPVYVNIGAFRKVLRLTRVNILAHSWSVALCCWKHRAAHQTAGCQRSLGFIWVIRDVTLWFSVALSCPRVNVSLVVGFVLLGLVLRTNFQPQRWNFPHLCDGKINLVHIKVLWIGKKTDYRPSICNSHS